MKYIYLKRKISMLVFLTNLQAWKMWIPIQDITLLLKATKHRTQNRKRKKITFYTLISFCICPKSIWLLCILQSAHSQVEVGSYKKNLTNLIHIKIAQNGNIRLYCTNLTKKPCKKIFET